ncbi:MAG: hypothetical protein ACYTGH_09030 [Planctomycetota bacterium]|jgi:hypothetical protein
MKNTVDSKQRGTALIMAMWLVIGIMGLTAVLFILMQSLSDSSTSQGDQALALNVVEAGLAHTISAVESAGVIYDQADQEYYGYIGQMHQDAGTQGHSWQLSGSAHGVTYFATVKSKYLCDKYGVGDMDYVAIPASTRNDLQAERFDIYEIDTTIIDPDDPTNLIGKHGAARRVVEVIELRKLQGEIPSPLYIHNDPDPSFAGNAFSVDGRDFMLPGTDGNGNPCPTCNGTLVTMIVPDGFALGAPGGGNGGGGSNGGGGTTDCTTCINALQATQENASPGLGHSIEYDPNWFGPNEADNIQTLDGNGNLVNLANSPDDVFVQTDIDLEKLAESFVGDYKNGEIKAGVNNYTDIANTTNLGSKDDFQVTYIGPNADLTVASNVQADGGGVLVIDGNIKISGQFKFYGIVIVLGDMSTTGGGSDIHVYGSLMAESESSVGGNADLYWCQDAIDKAMTELNPDMSVHTERLVWREVLAE